MPEHLSWLVQILVVLVITPGSQLLRTFTFPQPYSPGQSITTKNTINIIDLVLFCLPINSFFCRFDLIYLILDKADEQTDRRLAKHIVALHFQDPEVFSCTLFSHISY